MLKGNSHKVYYTKNHELHLDLEGVCMRPHFGLPELNFFQFGVWSISYKCLHKIPRNETDCGCCFITVILTEIKFHFG